MKQSETLYVPTKLKKYKKYKEEKFMETNKAKSNIEVTTLSPVSPEEKKSWLSGDH